MSLRGEAIISTSYRRETLDVAVNMAYGPSMNFHFERAHEKKYGERRLILVFGNGGDV